MGNQMVIVENIFTTLIRGVCYNGLHDLRSVFMGTFVCINPSFSEVCIFFFPTADLVNTAAWIFIQRDIVSVNQFGIVSLDVKCVIFCVMFIRFSAVVSKVIDVIKTYFILKLRIRHFFCNTGFDFRIQI